MSTIRVIKNTYEPRVVFKPNLAVPLTNAVGLPFLNRPNVFILGQLVVPARINSV